MLNIKRLTIKERRKIKELLSIGMSAKQISELIGRGKNTVNVELRRFPTRESYDPEIAQKLADERWDVLRINTKKVSDKEKDIILESLKKGHSYDAIAQLIGWTDSRVKRYVEKRETLSCYKYSLLKAKKDTDFLKIKVKNLEKQMQILYEIIKGVKNDSDNKRSNHLQETYGESSDM